MTAFLFPGQGAQFKGMGEGLFDDFDDLVSIADHVLGYSIKKLCLEDPNEQLQQTQYTQPALFVVNALTYFSKIRETGILPDYLAGHSLGEYNALYASGAFSFETGLKLVQKRGELMSQAKNGAMAAILGLDLDVIKQTLHHNNLSDIVIANHNSPIQYVISGPKDDVKKAGIHFEQYDDSFIPLNVSGAFHSSLMENASKEFREFIDKKDFSKLTIPVISNKLARPYQHNEIKQNISEHISSSVKWKESIEYLISQGENDFVESGPGTVLMSLNRQIISAIKIEETAPPTSRSSL